MWTDRQIFGCILSSITKWSLETCPSGEFELLGGKSMYQRDSFFLFEASWLQVSCGRSCHHLTKNLYLYQISYLKLRFLSSNIFIETFNWQFYGKLLKIELNQLKMKHLEWKWYHLASASVRTSPEGHVGELRPQSQALTSYKYH